MHFRMGRSKITCNIGVIIFFAILNIIMLLFLHLGPYWIDGGQGVWMICPSTGGCSFYQATDAENAARAMVTMALVCSIASAACLVLIIKKLHPRSPAFASLTGLAAVLFLVVTVALFASPAISGTTSYCLWIAVSCIFMLLSNSYSIFRNFRCNLEDSSRVDSTHPGGYPSRGGIPANQGRNTTTSGLASQPNGSPPYPGINSGNPYPPHPPPTYDNAAFSPQSNYPPPPAYSIYK